jgi:hypothetical protein
MNEGKPDPEKVQLIRKALAFARDAATKTNVAEGLTGTSEEVAFEIDARASGVIGKLRKPSGGSPER